MTQKEHQSTPFSYVEVAEQQRLNRACEEMKSAAGIMAEMTREQVAGR